MNNIFNINNINIIIWLARVILYPDNTQELPRNHNSVKLSITGLQCLS